MAIDYYMAVIWRGDFLGLPVLEEDGLRFCSIHLYFPAVEVCNVRGHSP
jgi:hypothetical protein